MEFLQTVCSGRKFLWLSCLPQKLMPADYNIKVVFHWYPGVTRLSSTSRYCCGHNYSATKQCLGNFSISITATYKYFRIVVHATLSHITYIDSGIRYFTQTLCSIKSVFFPYVGEKCLNTCNDSSYCGFIKCYQPGPLHRAFL